MSFILGKKLGMTTIYDEAGAHNVTLVECSPCTVSAVRTDEKDGYTAVQVETDKTAKKKFRKEFRVDELGETKKGDTLNVSAFEEGKKVVVSGVSKAKGFQGVVKRHGFAGSPATHGHRHDLRAPGSIGSAFPQHVIKGKKMAGRMGGERLTVKNLTVVKVDAENNIIALKGAVPGVNGRIVEIRA